MPTPENLNFRVSIRWPNISLTYLITIFFPTDIQHPRIQCPLDMTIPTETGRSYANVTWKLPVPTDNSNEHLILTGLTPPQKFNVGTNHITYKVTDSSGLSSSCTFSIQVKGMSAYTSLILCVDISLIPIFQHNIF